MEKHRKDQSIAKLASHLAELSRPSPLEFGQRVQRSVLEREAERVVERVEALSDGELSWLGLGDAWQVLELARASTSVTQLGCAIRCDRLRQLEPAGCTQALTALHNWAKASPRGLDAVLVLIFESQLDLTNDPIALDLAMRASQRGWRVATLANNGNQALIDFEMRSPGGESVSLASTETGRGLDSTIRFSSVKTAAASFAIKWETRAGQGRRIVVPDEGSPPSKPAIVATEERRSVADLFGDRIMLRDIEPRSPRLEGIESFRDELGWDETYVPRKNEPEYARALLRVMRSAGGAPEQIVYVGDTMLNDGGAIRGLQEVGPPQNVWGFLCGATASTPASDFTLDRIRFGSKWSSLGPFVRDAEAEGLVFGPGTWVLFDLDQTVYAAKGRADEPLIRARWDAVRGYLESVVPAYKFDPARAEALYREFDRDAYHPVTRDNMDYVVLLVLAVAAGLTEAEEIRGYASAKRPSIGALAEELQRRASMRVDHEDISAVLDAVKAVHYNTLAGDQTPCKDFRRFECLAMAARMKGDVNEQGQARIELNREVVALIDRLSATEANLLAVSDRPPEAAVIEADERGDGTDLMTVRMNLGE